MELTNDEVFDFIFREEYAKIPFIFRFSRRRAKIVGAILGALVLGMCVTTHILNSMDGIASVIIAAVLCIIVAGWMQAASMFEDRALRKASQFTFKYSLAEREMSRSRVNRIRQKSLE